jgi:hypothetical protein
MFDTMVRYVVSIELPPQQQRRVRGYMLNSKDMLALEFYRSSTLHYLSPELKEVLAEHSFGMSIRQVPFFNPTSSAALEGIRYFIPEVAQVMTSVCYCAQELIHRKGENIDSLKIVESGLVGYGGTVITVKGVFDLDFICSQARTSCFARAATHTTCRLLTRSDMERILNNGRFPEIKKSVHKVRIRIVVRHALKTMVKAIYASNHNEYVSMTRKEMAEYRQILFAKISRKRWRNAIFKVRKSCGHSIWCSQLVQMAGRADRLNVTNFNAVVAEVIDATTPTLTMEDTIIQLRGEVASISKKLDRLLEAKLHPTSQQDKNKNKNKNSKMSDLDLDMIESDFGL